MLEDFDFRVLDDASFKEDSVREEIVAPLLRRLGYSPSGPLRVLRSKTLKHPFVLIGARKHPVNIIPDYTLYHGDQAILILDAKAPNEPVVHSQHVEQAYSYAIHPEVRAWHFALCNGRELALYDIIGAEPAFLIPTSEIDARWSEVENYLSPAHLLDPSRRLFQPDLGNALARLGMADDAEHIFLGCQLQLVSRLDDDSFTAGSSCDFGGAPHLASFDFPMSTLGNVLSCLPESLRAETHRAFRRAPFQILADLMLELDLVTRLGKPTRGQHDIFRPLLVAEVVSSRFNTEPPQHDAVDVPPFVFHLRRAYERLADPPV